MEEDSKGEDWSLLLEGREWAPSISGLPTVRPRRGAFVHSKGIVKRSSWTAGADSDSHAHWIRAASEMQRVRDLMLERKDSLREDLEDQEDSEETSVIGSADDTEAKEWLSPNPRTKKPHSDHSLLKIAASRLALESAGAKAKSDTEEDKNCPSSGSASEAVSTIGSPKGWIFGSFFGADKLKTDPSRILEGFLLTRVPKKNKDTGAAPIYGKWKLRYVELKSKALIVHKKVPTEGTRKRSPKAHIRLHCSVCMLDETVTMIKKYESWPGFKVSAAGGVPVLFKVSNSKVRKQWMDATIHAASLLDKDEPAKSKAAASEYLSVDVVSCFTDNSAVKRRKSSISLPSSLALTSLTSRSRAKSLVFRLQVFAGELEYFVFKTYLHFQEFAIELSTELIGVPLPALPTPEEIEKRLAEEDGGSKPSYSVLCRSLKSEISEWMATVISAPGASTSVVMLSFLGLVKKHRADEPDFLKRQARWVPALQLDEILQIVDTGDVFLFRGTRLTSEAQRKITGALWDHVGIVFHVPTTARSARSLHLLEAVNSGVQIVPLMDQLKSYASSGYHLGFRKLRRFQEDPDWRKVNDFLLKVEGQPYRFFGGGEGWFCSELVAAALQELGALSPSIRAGSITPGWFSGEAGGAFCSEELLVVIQENELDDAIRRHRSHSR